MSNHTYELTVESASQELADKTLHVLLAEGFPKWTLRSEPRISEGGSALASHYAAAMARNRAVRDDPDNATDADKLRFLADLFDAIDASTGTKNEDQIQRDLRRMAERIESLEDDT